jgi:hypothetical protein
LDRKSFAMHARAIKNTDHYMGEILDCLGLTYVPIMGPRGLVLRDGRVSKNAYFFAFKASGAIELTG